MKTKNTRLNFSDLFTNRIVFFVDAEGIYPARIFSKTQKVALDASYIGPFDIEDEDDVVTKTHLLKEGYHVPTKSNSASSAMVVPILFSRNMNVGVNELLVKGELTHTNSVSAILHIDGKDSLVNIAEAALCPDYTSARIFSKLSQAERYFKRCRVSDGDLLKDLVVVVVEDVNDTS